MFIEIPIFLMKEKRKITHFSFAHIPLFQKYFSLHLITIYKFDKTLIISEIFEIFAKLALYLKKESTDTFFRFSLEKSKI